MIVDDRITTYLHSLEMPDIPVIEEIEKEAKERNIALPDFYGVGLDIFSSDLDQILSDFRNYLSQKAD